MIKGSKELIRSINCTNVLENIINSEPISRAYLSKKLGLTKATISSIVQDLINQKLIIEIGSDKTKFGRKPILLAFNKKGGYAISIELGSDIIAAMITDLKGDSSQYKQIQTPESEKELLPTLITLIQSMEKLTKKSTFGIIGISISIHGIVVENEILQSKPTFTIDIKKKLEQYFQIPVYLESDASLSALGEYTYKSTYSSLANLTIHDSVSLGIVLNHVLCQGNNQFTGAIGHMIAEPSNFNSSSKTYKNLEQYLSLDNLLKTYQDISNDKNKTIKDLYQGYRKQESSAIDVIHQFTKYTAFCIHNILTIYNPDILILNCPITKKFPELLTEIKQLSLCSVNTHTRIFLSNMNDSSLYGGICICVKNFLHINHFIRGIQEDLMGE